MSVEDTNTPNGGSNNLYEKNLDTGEQTICITDMTQCNPEKDFTGEISGDNTKIGSTLTVNTDTIRNFGSVSIPTVTIGQPTIEKSVVKKAVEEVKKTLLQKSGVVSREEYEKMLIEKAGKTKSDKEEKEEKKERE